METTRPTRVPPAPHPTSPPPFDLDAFARDSSRMPALLSSMVVAVVPGISWADAKLDFVELALIRSIDGVCPVLLLESATALPRDELNAILTTFLARGLVVVVDIDEERTGNISARPPASGVYHRGTTVAVEDDVAKAG